MTFEQYTILSKELSTLNQKAYKDSLNEEEILTRDGIVSTMWDYAW